MRITDLIYTDGFEKISIFPRSGGCDLAAYSFGELDGENADRGTSAIDEDVLTWFKFGEGEKGLVSCGPTRPNTSGLCSFDIRRPGDCTCCRDAYILSESAREWSRAER